MNEASPPRHDKFRAYRERKKAAGRREVRLWLPDVRSPTFISEARRQAALLDHSSDEQEAANTMRTLASDAWSRAD
ncbi:MAG: antitoxin MazE-like protein [Sphingomicrobium sp.]